MDEPNMEADGVQQERQANNENTWKAYPLTMLWMPLMSRPVR